MSPPRRRSSRLGGRSSQSSTPARKVKHTTASRMSSLAECDENKHSNTSTTPTHKNNALHTLLSSPAGPQTPATAGRIQPSIADMHPQLIHQSTTDASDEGLAFGFIDVHDARNGAISGTPSKAATFTSPSFNFRYAPAQHELGPAAQRVRQELQEEAMKIKARLVAEQKTETSSGEEQNGQLLGRKIAVAKGTAGRYSDVHKQEFKKMDSIANHPSSFRAQPGRQVPLNDSLSRSKSKTNIHETFKSSSTPVSQHSSKGSELKAQLTEVNVSLAAPVSKSLKRTLSKAQLDESTDGQAQPSYKALKRTQSIPRLAAREDGPSAAVMANRLEPALGLSSTKRAGFGFADQMAQTAQKIAHGIKPVAGTPSRTQAFLDNITTPTQASLSRAATTKDIKHFSNIPTLSRSPTKPSLQIVKSPAQALVNASAVSNLGSIARSIFRRSPEKSRVPVSKGPMLSATLATTSQRVNRDKDLPSIPRTPETSRTTTVLHGNTPLKQGPGEVQYATTPSPHKSGIPRSHSTMKLGLPIVYPDISAKMDIKQPKKEISYPKLEKVVMPKQHFEANALEQTQRMFEAPAVPGMFTFRAGQALVFGNSPRSNGKPPHISSIRAVRPSMAPTDMPGSFPHSFAETNKENTNPVAPIFEYGGYKHGMSGKKRARVDVEDVENADCQIDERSPKKHKAQHETAGPSETTLQQKLTAEKTATGTKIQHPQAQKKKTGLSMSRLNMLARPKNRK